MLRQSSSYIGIGVLAAFLGIDLVFGDVPPMSRIVGYGFLGVVAWALANVAGIWAEVAPYAYGPAPLEEEAEEQAEIEEAAPLHTRDRLIVQGQVVPIPEELRGPVNQIAELRMAGELPRISARELERRMIASRETGQAQRIMEWLERVGVIVQKPYQPAEWVGDDLPPTPESIPVF